MKLENRIWDLEALQDKGYVVVEASIWKHITARTHLRVLDGDEGGELGDIKICLCYIGITSPRNPRSPVSPFSFSVDI